MHADIIVVGSYNLDFTFSCNEFPRPGQTVPGTMRTGHGGKGSNQAVAAARAGGRVTFVGAVGDDLFGTAARAFHAQEGIDWQACIHPGAATGSAAILLNGEGENQIVVAGGANLGLRPEELPPEIFNATRLFVCQLEIDPRTTLSVLQRARASGSAALLNPAPMRSDLDAALFAAATLLVPNETEFLQLLSAFHPEGHRFQDVAGLEAVPPSTIHAWCRAFGWGDWVITLGSRGCLVSTRQGWWRLPAYDRIPVVDTVGAGDAFIGGLSVAWSGGQDLPAACAFASAVAALSVTKPGAAPAMPHRSEIDAFLAERGLLQPVLSSDTRIYL